MQQSPQTRPKSHHWPVLIGLIAGAAGGLLARQVFPSDTPGKPHEWVQAAVDNVAYPAGQIFLRLMFMTVIPLVFSALLLGVAGLGDVRRLGRVGLTTLGLTIVFSTISVVIGLTLVNTLQPGKHLPEEQRTVLRDRYAADAAKFASDTKSAKSARDSLLDVVPRNPLREIVGAVDGSSPGGGMLAVMFFALTFGIALLATPATAGPVIAVMDGVFHASMAIIRFAMWLAPVGVAGLMFSLTAVIGIDVLRILAWFFATALGGLLLQFFGVYSVAIALLARMNPLDFFRRLSEVIVTAFATSSSNATLPTALRVSQNELGIRKEISNFVLTVGATANQNGTALYEGVTILFLCQAFGVDLSLQQQITVAVTCIVAGIGTAGVPSGAIPFIALVLASLGVPAEAIGIILGLDRILDMCRTVVNVTGDITIAACVDRMTGPATMHEK
ncbi:MAG: dicarboxylate/amino acid:cation symporter [Phycisphaerae bacterium]